MSKLTTKSARKRINIMKRVNAVVAVGEQVTSHEVMQRLHDSDCAWRYIPRCVHSLSMLLKGSGWDRENLGSEKKRHYAWRRAE